MINSTGLEVVKKYKNLVYKVLHQCHISSLAADFDDYRQELRWHLYQLAEPFDSLSAFEEQYAVAYLYKRLCWFTLDMWRKANRHTEQQESDECLTYFSVIEDGMEEIECQLMLEAFYQSLTPTDQRKLRLLLTDATLSRQLKSYYRRVLREKFRLFFQIV